MNQLRITRSEHRPSPRRDVPGSGLTVLDEDLGPKRLEWLKAWRRASFALGVTIPQSVRLRADEVIE